MSLNISNVYYLGTIYLAASLLLKHVVVTIGLKNAIVAGDI